MAATCTYSRPPAARPRLSSTCSAPTSRSSWRTRGRNVGSNSWAARCRTPATNPVETPTEHRSHQPRGAGHRQVMGTHQFSGPGQHPRPVLRAGRRTLRRSTAATAPAPGTGPGDDLMLGHPRRRRGRQVHDLAARHIHHRRPRQVLPTVPQQTGSHTIISSGSSTSGITEPGAPGCLPGRRPEKVREERLTGVRYGEFDDGGRLEVNESAPAAAPTPRSAAPARRSGDPWPQAPPADPRWPTNSTTNARSSSTEQGRPAAAPPDTPPHDEHQPAKIKSTLRSRPKQLSGHSRPEPAE